VGVAVLVARAVLAAVFAAAGAAKLADPQGSRRAASDFGVPQRLTAAVALGLPLAELAAAAKRVFDLRAQRPRPSWSECCRVLEEAGVLNRRGEPYWTHGAVAKIVRNPAYLGQARLGQFVKEGAHEPLVDPATWRAAQSAAGETTRGSEGALLAGVLLCTCCGRRMTPSLKDGRYRCRPRIVA
jgi:Recombinase